MLAKSVLIIAAWVVGCASANGRCTYYYHDREGYSCSLDPVNALVKNFVIHGSHLLGKSDSDVKFISMLKGSIMAVIPPSIFEKFVNVEAVDFIDMDLTTLTVESFEKAYNVKRFYLYRNKLTSLPGNLFVNTKVESISLQENQISHISFNAFAGATGLRTLHLHRNNISWTIHPDLFQQLTNLRTLNLWGNQLTEISSKTFRNLLQLEILSLGINRLTRLDKPTFNSLKALRVLHFDSNDIKYIESGFFDLFPLLENVKFEKNPCADFNLESFKNKLDLLNLLTKCFPPSDEMYQCYSTCQAIDGNQI